MSTDIYPAVGAGGSDVDGEYRWGWWVKRGSGVAGIGVYQVLGSGWAISRKTAVGMDRVVHFADRRRAWAR